MKILRDSILQTEKVDFNTLLSGLFDTFLKDLLVYRSRVEEEGIVLAEGKVEAVEEAVIECLVSGIVLKLSETVFRPFYHRLYDWASESLAKKITFYRFSGYAAQRLKSLFVTFAGYVIGPAAESLNEDLELTKAILHYLYHIFLNDREGFVTPDRFNTLAKPLVDLIESEAVVSKAIPIQDLNSTIVQLAVATNDVNRWHHLMDLVVMKADSEDSRVRLFTIGLFEAIANELEKDFLELLPPTVQTLSNLLGDDDEVVQKETRKMLVKLEAILGEPLQPYFSS
jgi:U3 small nucleolar RNA-associated protein 10